MTLEELLWLTNDNTIIELYDSNQEKLGEYDGKNSIDENYNDYPITDIFVEGNKLCVKIETEGD